MKRYYILTGLFVFLFQACGEMKSNELASLNSSLNTPQAATFFKCSNQDPLEISDLKRLTKKEYLNTLTDLLVVLSSGEQSALKTQIDSAALLLPEDNLSQYEKFDSRISQNHISTQYDIAYVVAKRVNLTTNKATFFGTCMNVQTPTQVCVKAFIQKFGLQVFRRPLTTQEVDELYLFYQGRGNTGSADLVARLLMHPNFLYHVENQGSQTNSDEYKLTGYEVASRLSYLYLQSMPNAMLLNAASTGQLDTISGVDQAINQLFVDEAAKLKITFNFYISEWLDFKFKPGFGNSPKILALAKLTGLSGTPDDALRTEMLEELLDLVSYYTWNQENGNFNDILNSDLSFAKGDRLAGLYNLPKWVQGQLPSRFPARERSGLFTRAGSLYSGSERTSPIHYGVATIRKVLCDDIPNPPQSAIDSALRNPNIDYVNKTQREIVQEMTSSSSCSGCHKTINPYGFAIEAYDAFGSFRANSLEYKFDDQGQLINSLPTQSQVDVVIGSGQTVSVKNAVDMNLEISKSGKAHACFVRNFYRFSQRRLENETSDHCGMSKLYSELTRPQGGLKDMFKAIGSDPQFLNRRVGL